MRHARLKLKVLTLSAAMALALFVAAGIVSPHITLLRATDAITDATADQQTQVTRRAPQQSGTRAIVSRQYGGGIPPPPLPGPTPTPTVTATVTATPTATVTVVPTATPTVTVVPTATPTATVTVTPTPTPSPTPTPTTFRVDTDISIQLRRGTFSGHVETGGSLSFGTAGFAQSFGRCENSRKVALRKSRKGPDRTVGTDFTNSRGNWAITPGTFGLHYAVATRKVFEQPDGDTVICLSARSATLRQPRQ